MVAEKSPMTTKETERPAIVLAGPQRCSEAAAPSTMGRIGSTHGERMDSVPATKARGTAPAVMAELEGLVEQRRDRGAVGVAHRAAGFLIALERNQRRLRAHAEGLHGVLLAIEIDHEIHEILELRRGHQLAEDRVLGLAGRTPRSVYADEDRLAGLLRLGECFWIEGFGFGGQRRHREPGVGSNCCENEGPARQHLNSPPFGSAFPRPEEKMHISQVAVLPIKLRSSAALPAALGIPMPSAAGIESGGSGRLGAISGIGPPNRQS